MAALQPFDDDAEFIDFVVAQIEEHIDTDPFTWNKASGVVQFAGEAVRFVRSDDILTVTVRGEEIMRLR